MPRQQIYKRCDLGATNLSFFVWLIKCKYNVNMHMTINYIEANITVWIGLRKYRSYPEIAFSSLMLIMIRVNANYDWGKMTSGLFVLVIFGLSVKQGLLFLLVIMVTYSIDPNMS